ncbi:MAG: type II toxin-antitoxin system RelE/ParE family toxin [Gammaproteobacteria bacterium]|nr:type II toxin-antitoxin system RelE/ParE family toxin [Gammaproteobacteria bacterium]MDQ7076083.1 type II toxin-antitoxin system RelE/ParE family toxin [Gammaproteobacteria bacterium]
MYHIELMSRAVKDLKQIPKLDAKKVVGKLQQLENGLSVNVKKLTNFSPEYRLRVGDYRVLFEIENQLILVYRVKHRKDAYGKG